MSSSKNPQGKRIFDDVYNFPQDTQSLADDIWDAYVTRAITSGERGLIPHGQLRNGLVVRETDTGLIWQRDEGDWKVIGGRTPLAIMRRTNTSLNAAGGAYTNLSASAAWTASNGALRGCTYSDGIVVSLAGWYDVFWTIKGADGTNGGLMGIAVNQTSGISGESLQALDHVTNKVIVLGAATGRVKLAAGDKLTLWGYGDGGTMFIRPSSTLEPSHWGVRWVAAA